MSLVLFCSNWYHAGIESLWSTMMIPSNPKLLETELIFLHNGKVQTPIGQLNYPNLFFFSRWWLRGFPKCPCLYIPLRRGVVELLVSRPCLE
jgi:hypothetical protein